MLAEVSCVLAIPASIFGAVSLIFVFAFCICGWKTKEPKDEFVGVEGRVKITNPEEYQYEVNANNIQTELIGDKCQNTAKRSLPDLPVDSHSNGRSNVNWEPSGDAASELYATVVLQDEKNKKHKREKSDTDSISPSLTYSNVKKDHPYDKLKNVEHPYAQVKDNENEKRTTTASHVNSINKEEEESDREEFESNLMTSIRCGNESSGNIPAATAITGHVSASEDLPYMTPPAHFSGDSQDSGKGYTSISVREPLSTIQAESKAKSAERPDSHYATVSDDSDDMYAAIDDPNQTYTSESETYAQINSRSNRPKSAPQPPSVDSLKQMTTFSQSHSRQASSSSLTSSSVISSPKPEKRPANSPLPPTPTKSPETTENSSSGDNLRQLTCTRNVEDMYAKVNKKTRREVDVLERGGSTESGVSDSSDSLSLKLQTASTTESSRSCHSYLSKSTLTDTTTSSCSSNGQIPTDTFSSETDPRSGYEKFDGGSFEFDRKSDPGYETVNKGPSSESDPEYEKLKPQIHDYINVESSKSGAGSGGGDDCHSRYAKVRDKAEMHGNDGYGYARVNSDTQENEIYSKIEACGSDGYARVEPHKIFNSDDGYAKVLKHNNNRVEPKYEKVTFHVRNSLEQQNPEEIQKEKLHSEQLAVEPTYESLGNELEPEELIDPNYERVRYTGQTAQIEPAYQLLRDCESGGSVPED